MNKEEQEIVLKLSLYEQQIKQLEQQLQAVEKTISEMLSLKKGLDELKGNIGKEIFAPLGKGIFVKAKVISEELIVDIGWKNFVKKSIPETKELIESQIKKLEDAKTELSKSMEALGREVEKIISDASMRSY